MFKNRLCYCLICSIIAISFLGNWYVFETKRIEAIGKLEKTIILSLWFLSMALLGYAVLRIAKKKWAITFWVMQYALALLLCIVYAGIYFLASKFPILIKTAMVSVRNFYLTPFPLALILVMLRVENKKSSND